MLKSFVSIVFGWSRWWLCKVLKFFFHSSSIISLLNAFYPSLFGNSFYKETNTTLWLTKILKPKLQLFKVKVTPPSSILCNLIEKVFSTYLCSSVLPFSEVRLLIYAYLGNQYSNHLRAYHYNFGHSIHHIFFLHNKELLLQ